MPIIPRILSCLLALASMVISQADPPATTIEDKEIELVKKKISLIQKYLEQNDATEKKNPSLSFESLLQEHLEQKKKQRGAAEQADISLNKLSLDLFPIFETRNPKFAEITHADFVFVKQYQTRKYRRRLSHPDNFESKIIVCATAKEFLVFDYELELIHSENLEVQTKFFKNLRSRESSDSKRRLTL